MIEVKGEYLIRYKGRDLTVVQISDRNLVPTDPAEVRVLDGDGDEHRHLDHHRVEEGAHQGHTAARLDIRGEMEEDLLQDLRREMRESGPVHI